MSHPVIQQTEPKVPEPVVQASLSQHYESHRLSMPAEIRILLATSFAAITGLSLGLSHGGTMAALRFRAENAHRLPKSQAGWYLYHKTKNYHVMFGALKEGAKVAGRFGGWVGGFMLTEEAIDKLRGRKDFMSSTVAGTAMAGAFSVIYHQDMITAARTTKLGLVMGLGYGLTQDLLALLQGQRPAYANLILRFIGKGKTDKAES